MFYFQKSRYSIWNSKVIDPLYLYFFSDRPAAIMRFFPWVSRTCCWKGLKQNSIARTYVSKEVDQSCILYPLKYTEGTFNPNCGAILLCLPKISEESYFDYFLKFIINEYIYMCPLFPREIYLPEKVWPILTPSTQ